jgi:magnesium transporter
MTDTDAATAAEQEAAERDHIATLLRSVRRRAPLDAYDILEGERDEVIARVLGRLRPQAALQILLRFPESRRDDIVPEVTAPVGTQWEINQRYPEDSVGLLMSRPTGVMAEELTVGEAIERVRELAAGDVLFTYIYAVDLHESLQGLVVMRDLMLADPGQRLRDIMLTRPFYLDPNTPVREAMRQVMQRSYPVYPVCDEDRRIVGLVEGYMLYEEHAFEITAQPGRMVGVESEEHPATPWPRSFKNRHPWLQLNLFTAFLAAAVVGVFESTIAQIVALAAFLPVLAGQSGNTGCQALAVTIRGMTLEEFPPGLARRLVGKEALLGLLNGLLVGLTAGIGMYVYAGIMGAAGAFTLALVVVLAMVASCVVSGVCGVLVPVTLKRFGADPATASSIFLTTATDVASMGLFLALATAFLL